MEDLSAGVSAAGSFPGRHHPGRHEPGIRTSPGRRPHRDADGAAGLGPARARAAPGPERRLPGVLRPLLRRPRLPRMRRARGGDDGPDDAIENCQRLADPARPRRRRRDPARCTRRPGRATSASTPQARTTRGAVRPRRDVLQGIPRHVRLAAQRRGAHGLQPRRGSRDPQRSPVPAAGPALRRAST